MEKKTPDLYYYTTVETMRFILQNGNIYATNLKYMNDSEEYSNGLVEMRKILNEQFPQTRNIINESELAKRIEGHPEIYSISFSTQRDLLSQWSMYAGESGVSLKIDFDCSLKYLFYSDKAGKVRDYSREKIRPRRVYYITENAMEKKAYDSVKNEIIGEIFKQYNKVTLGDMEGENAINVWQDMTPYIKRYEFFSEGEYRLAYSTWDFPNAVRIDYRNDRHVLKPYLDVECEGGWPVTEIIVGPGFNQQVVFTSLKHYIEHAKLKIHSVDEAEFCKRCEDYLCIKENIPKPVYNIWQALKVKLLIADVNNRYRQFCEIIQEIKKNKDIDDNYKNYLANRYLSKDGILITKSDIPYIY